MFTLVNSTTLNSTAVWYDPGFKRFLETYMGYLRSLTTNTYITVDAHSAYKYEGDFYGLLTSLKLDSKYYWVIMRLNDLVSPGVTLEGATSLMLPDSGKIEKIRLIYTATLKKR